MTPRIATALGAAILVVLVVGSALWVGRYLGQLRSSSIVAPTPTTLPTVIGAIAPTATPVPVPRGYRLAGVAARAALTYAVIESPDDKHTMYHEGDEIPGLGRLVRIADAHVVIAAPAGELRLPVAPGATLTPTHTRPPATPTLRRLPASVPSIAGTPRGSTPSGAPG